MLEEKLTKDYEKTKLALVDQLAKLYIDNVLGYFEMVYAQRAREAIDSYVTVTNNKPESLSTTIASYRDGFMKRGTNDANLYKRKMDEFYDEYSSITFEGDSVIPAIKAFYKENSNNEKGLYFTPLIEIISQIEGKRFDAPNKTVDIEVVDVTEAVVKFFITMKPQKAIIKFKLSPFLIDFIESVKKNCESNNLKITVTQFIGWFLGDKNISEYPSQMSIEIPTTGIQVGKFNAETAKNRIIHKDKYEDTAIGIEFKIEEK